MYVHGLRAIRGLRGFGDVYSDWGWGEADPGAGAANDNFAWGDVPGYGAESLAVPVPAASNTGPTSSWDWSGLLKTAMQTYGTVVGSQKPSTPTAPPAPSRMPVSSPFTGFSAAGAGGLTLALGVAALALIALKQR